MLYLTFCEPEHLDRSPGLYFDNRYSPEWFNDPVVQDIVQDVDGIKIVGPYLAIDPILGAIPPTQISNGASIRRMSVTCLSLKTSMLFLDI